MRNVVDVIGIEQPDPAGITRDVFDATLAIFRIRASLSTKYHAHLILEIM
jgi:hypothetical protein